MVFGHENGDPDQNESLKSDFYTLEQQPESSSEQGASPNQQAPVSSPNQQATSQLVTSLTTQSGYSLPKLSSINLTEINLYNLIFGFEIKIKPY